MTLELSLVNTEVCQGSNYEIDKDCIYTTNNHLQNELSNVTEELAKIYHHICTANNITPSRVMLEHSKGEWLLLSCSFSSERDNVH